MSAETVASLGTKAERTRGVVRCRSVRARLPGELLGTWPLSPAAQRHLEVCLTCQAQAARYRAVLRALRSLRDEIEESPAWVLDRVLSALEVPEPDHESRVGRAIAVSAIAASVAAAAAVALMRWIRSGAV